MFKFTSLKVYQDNDFPLELWSVLCCKRIKLCCSPKDYVDYGKGSTSFHEQLQTDWIE